MKYAVHSLNANRALDFALYNTTCGNACLDYKKAIPNKVQSLIRLVRTRTDMYVLSFSQLLKLFQHFKGFMVIYNLYVAAGLMHTTEVIQTKEG